MAKTGDKLKPNTKAWHARQERWRHNAFFGHCAMMRVNAYSIFMSNTATDETKNIARQIHNLTFELAAALKIRKPGT